MAIQCIYRDLEYAKSVIKSKTTKNAAMASSPDGTIADDSDDEEENWTIIDDDNIDPDFVMKKSGLSQVEASGGGSAVPLALGSRLLGGIPANEHMKTSSVSGYHTGASCAHMYASFSATSEILGASPRISRNSLSKIWNTGRAGSNTCPGVNNPEPFFQGSCALWTATAFRSTS